MAQVLELMEQYKISSAQDHGRVVTALELAPEDWVKEVNRIAIENNFQEIGKVKNIVELVSELKEHNGNVKSLADNYFVFVIERIKDTQLTSSLAFIRRKPISKWGKEEISDWTKAVKSAVKSGSFNLKDYHIITETISVIMQANFLETRFYLTDSQILSCVLSLMKSENKGLLFQVSTGEGKSTIVCVLAIILALQGKKVDIITSSPVLAERDDKGKANLYKIFGLTCGNNNDRSIYVKGAKDCYKKDIVYGEVAQFQFDILRDQYSLLETLGDRKCEVAIVDEVDSMLIDDSSKIARLSSNIAGMDLLQPIYYFIWQRLTSLQEKIMQIDERNYLLYGKVSFSGDKIVLEYADNNEEIVQVSDLENHIRSTKDISSIGKSIEMDIEVFLKTHLENYTRDLVGKGIVKVPKNFSEFVEKQIPNWVDSAIRALGYQEKVHYIVHDDVIKPVDFDSTGIVQSSTSWSNGLHQFLQIKHQLKMTSETLTTNFLSNVSFFKMYGSNLYGLIGTLGSEKAKKVLAESYKLDFILISSTRRKQYVEFPPIIAANYDHWLDEICSAAITEAVKERGTLIICESIDHAEIIAHKMRERYRAETIKLYTMNNMNQEHEIDHIRPGNTIVATNLAGRGTDIKTIEIEKNGGLHVIVTFMPPNQRVEDQAFGRTGRQGKRGTGQMILNAMDLIKYGHYLSEKIKSARDDLESKMLDEFVKEELKVIMVKDELFRKFCDLLKAIRRAIRENSSLLQKITRKFSNDNSYFETNIVLALEERWAFFLHKIDDKSIPLEQSCLEFERFSQEVVADYHQKKLIKNPYYHIAIGNDFTLHDSSLNDNYNEAMYHFEQAITLDPDFSGAAFFGKGWLLLKGETKLIGDNKQRIDYKQKAIEEFNKALKFLGDEMGSITAVQVMLQQQDPSFKSDLAKKLVQKANILGSFLNSIHNVVSVIKKSLRLIDVVAVKEVFLQAQSKGSKTITNITGVERTSSGKLSVELPQVNNLEVIFNELTAFKDGTVVVDQAIRTVDHIFENASNSVSNAVLDAKKFRGIGVRTQIQVYTLKAILNPNTEMVNLNKEAALFELRKKYQGWIYSMLRREAGLVDLMIILHDKMIESKNKIRVDEAIKIVEAKEDDNLMFNLVFINDNADKANSMQNQVLSECRLDLEFSELDSEAAKYKLEQIEAKKIDLEVLTAVDQKLLTELACLGIGEVLLVELKNGVYRTVSLEEIRRRANGEDDKEISLKIENINISQARAIITSCPESTFTLNFVAVD